MGYKVEIEEITPFAMFDLRGRDPVIDEYLESKNLPVAKFPAMIVSSEGVDVVRVGPQRVLVLSNIDNEIELFGVLRSGTAGTSLHCTLISDMYTGITVKGEDAWQIMAQVTSCDFQECKDESAVATEIFGLAGYIIRHGVESYTIFAESSYSDYVLDRLKKCALIT